MNKKERLVWLEREVRNFNISKNGSLITLLFRLIVKVPDFRIRKWLLVKIRRRAEAEFSNSLAKKQEINELECSTPGCKRIPCINSAPSDSGGKNDLFCYKCFLGDGD